MVERWYVTIRISETADGDYSATEPGRPQAGRGRTPIRALVDYAHAVERGTTADRSTPADRADRADRTTPADRADRADNEQPLDSVERG